MHRTVMLSMGRPCTHATRCYNRTNDQITLDEVEIIVI